MKISLTCPLFVLKSEKNDDVRKNDLKRLSAVVTKDKRSSIEISFDNKTGIKKLVREKIMEIVGSDKFHLEQVYTLGEERFFEDGKIDVIYLACMNEENIKKLDKDYELIDFSVSKENYINFGEVTYNYKTRQNIVGNNIEYFHEIECNDLYLEKVLLEFLIAYKQIISKIDFTDICFKFLPKYFTLEDVRAIYEMIKEVNVDKSNFRKRIIKYCEKTDKIVKNKGYRPSQVYVFKNNFDDIWI